MDDPQKVRTPSHKLLNSTGWDGAPDNVISLRLERISEETRELLLAACRAASMDGFLLAAALIPAKIDGEGYSLIDEARQGSGFTNLAHGADLGPLFLWATERLKGRK